MTHSEAWAPEGGQVERVAPGRLHELEDAEGDLAVGGEKCSIRGCPGEYEPRLIVHTVKRGKDVLVFEDVPAEVCDVCSDILLAPETVRHVEELMGRDSVPRTHAPVYAYA